MGKPCLKCGIVCENAEQQACSGCDAIFAKLEKTFYGILGVQFSSSTNEIIKAFRARSQDESDGKRLKLLEEAFQVLSNSERRAEYDAKLSGLPYKKPASLPSSNAANENIPPGVKWKVAGVLAGTCLFATLTYSSAPVATMFFVLIMIFLCFVLLPFTSLDSKAPKSTLNPSLEAMEEYKRKRDEYKKQVKYGQLTSEMICPHCQTKGKVYVKKMMQKKGVSGTKAAAALLTGGASILLAGLSRKESVTQAYCDNCRNDWQF